MRTAFEVVASAVERVAGVRTHLGKLKAWSSGGGEAPDDLHALEAQRAHRHPGAADDPTWRADLPGADNGLLVSGTPIGTPAFAAAQGRTRSSEVARLLAELPRLEDLQAAWLLVSF